MNDATLPLSPIDHVFTGAGSYPIEFAFAYKGALDPDRLRESLDQVLEPFWPLRSKLVRISDDVYGFQPAEDGLSFTTGNSPDNFDDSHDPARFLDPVHTAEEEPLTRIRLTQTPGGSVLGVSISHALVDGYSYFHFLASWSRAFHGKRLLAPSHRRELLRPADSGSQAPVTPEEVLARCGLFWGEKRSTVSRDQIREERLLLSKEAMDRLLAEAQEDCEVPLFHNDAITAYLWKRCITQWNDGVGSPTVYVSCPVDFRRALRALPRTYFGCAPCFATAAIDYEGLASAPLGQLALLVRSAVAQVKNDYVEFSLQTLDRLRRQEGLAAMEALHVLHPRNGLVVTNISRLPVGSLDFGAGTPSGFQASSSTPRGAAILPAGDGVEIRIFHP